MNTERLVWVYWISRDSIRGELVKTCSIWWSKPRRVAKRGCVTWVESERNGDTRFGDYPLDETRRFCGTTPETDLELIKVEQWARDEKPEAAAPKRRRKVR